MGTAMLAAFVIPIGAAPFVERAEFLDAVQSLRRLESGMLKPDPTDAIRSARRDRLTALLQFIDPLSREVVAGTANEVALLNFHTAVRDLLDASEAVADNSVQALTWRRAGAALAHRLESAVARRAANGISSAGAVEQAVANAALLQEHYRVLFQRLLTN